MSGDGFADDTEVLYNKFNVTSSSSQHPNSDYSCAVATADHWRIVRCDERHHVVCQSDYLLPGRHVQISISVFTSTLTLCDLTHFSASHIRISYIRKTVNLFSDYVQWFESLDHLNHEYASSDASTHITSWHCLSRSSTPSILQSKVIIYSPVSWILRIVFMSDLTSLSVLSRLFSCCDYV